MKEFIGEVAAELILSALLAAALWIALRGTGMTFLGCCLLVVVRLFLEHARRVWILRQMEIMCQRLENRR